MSVPEYLSKGLAFLSCFDCFVWCIWVVAVFTWLLFELLGVLKSRIRLVYCSLEY